MCRAKSAGYTQLWSMDGLANWRRGEMAKCLEIGVLCRTLLPFLSLVAVPFWRRTRSAGMVSYRLMTATTRSRYISSSYNTTQAGANFFIGSHLGKLMVIISVA